MIVLILIVLGLCFGSFVNAWVWRLHEQSKPRAKRAAKDTELSITKGRSMCTDCKHTLAGKDLIPVLSWLSLGGKCRYCKKPISWHYPFVELLTAVLFVSAFLAVYPTEPHNQLLYFASFSALLVSIVIGMALAVYDFKWMKLPTRLVRILSVFTVIFAISQLVIGDWTFIGVFFAVLLSGGLFWLLYHVSDGKWIGGGDVRLGFSLGLLLGTPDKSFLMLFTASLFGVIFALVLLLLGKYHRGTHIPFGPFLLMATYVTVLYGQQLTNYYQTLILP